MDTRENFDTECRSLPQLELMATVAEAKDCQQKGDDSTGEEGDEYGTWLRADDSAFTVVTEGRNEKIQVPKPSDATRISMEKGNILTMVIGEFEMGFSTPELVDDCTRSGVHTVQHPNPKEQKEGSADRVGLVNDSRQQIIPPILTRNVDRDLSAFLVFSSGLSKGLEGKRKTVVGHKKKVGTSKSKPISKCPKTGQVEGSSPSFSSIRPKDDGPLSSKAEAEHGAVLTIPMAENVEQAKLGLENILCDLTSSHVLYIVVVPKENPHTDASSKVLVIPSSSSLSPRV
ncbi:hypothetical protein FEM48_Zijuj10G0073000 [Ziziphus jujuba var. spinosa]|uniref:Uncharacterized protein n=1 Tax=Ziziphus jujuba var. spinosa TaxID=714518 RepID=A0A978UM25_ZIZJJ|nr:hypothetical protein FEM48_Zijuj10G0073000 [Ziziphus jujuba var. spinosa]